MAKDVGIEKNKDIYRGKKKLTNHDHVHKFVFGQFSIIVSIYCHKKYVEKQVL